MSKPSAPVSILLGRFRRLARRDAQVWQCGIVRWPMWVDSPTAGRPTRPNAALWVAKPAGLIGMHLLEADGETDVEAAVRAVVDLALRHESELMGRPGRIEVMDARFGTALVAELGDPGVVVDVVPELRDVKEVLASFVAHEQERSPVPTLMSIPFVTLEDVREFAAAAARFYRAEPWQHLMNDDVLAVELPGLDAAARYAVVMGNAGMQFGISFYDSPEAIEAFADDPTTLRRGKTTYWAVTFSLPEEMPIPDLVLWEDHALPLADESAYPVPIGYGPGDRAVRPPRKLFHAFTSALAALADTSEAEIDTGRWTKPVSAGGRQVEVTLTLPHVLAPESAQAARLPTAFDRRRGERVHADISRFLAEHEFGSLEDVNAALRDKFSGKLDDAPRAPGTTPLECAQDIVYDAFDAIGRRRVILARQALAVSPDCADAHVILAESAAGPSRALPLYEAAMAAGERAIGAKRFADLAGEFWGALETRPYMRARLGLAQTLAALDRAGEAEEHYRALLQLNPNDNQGVRYLLLEELVVAGRDDEAVALLQRYPDDVAAEWRFTWALIDFRQGRLEDADRRLAAALDYNPAVALMVAAGEGPLPMVGPTARLGGPDEAAGYAEAFGDAWRATPGAVEWLVGAGIARARRAPKGRGRQRAGAPRRGKRARGPRGN
jgi:tetratricopeptide (TPR) repeat protein